METIRNTKSMTNATEGISQRTGKCNPYQPTNKLQVPLALPKGKVVVSRKHLNSLRTLTGALAGIVVVLVAQIFVMDRANVERYKKYMYVQNNATIKRTMELVDITDGIATFTTDDDEKFVASLPNETIQHLVIGDKYGVAYTNTGLVYLGAFNR